MNLEKKMYEKGYLYIPKGYNPVWKINVSNGFLHKQKFFSFKENEYTCKGDQPLKNNFISLTKRVPF